MLRHVMNALHYQATRTHASPGGSRAFFFPLALIVFQLKRCISLGAWSSGMILL